MPGVTAVIDRACLEDRAFNISRPKVELVRETLKTATAKAMNSLDWDNKELRLLDPDKQITPVIMLAGDITLGDAIEIATPDVAAIVHIWAFDYPSRNGVGSMNEINQFGPDDQELIRRLGLMHFPGERLGLVRDRLKKTLGTDRQVEVNFVPQRENHWVGG